MFDRLGNGWEVAKQSWAVLRQDKELLLFPVLSGIAAFLILASFAVPCLLVPGLRTTIEHAFQDRGPNNSAGHVIALIVAFAYYVLNYFVIVYFNTALAACAIYRFRGGEPTVSIGLKLASERLPQIFAWAVVAATVGMIIRAVEERSEWVGRIIMAVVGGLWTLATFFVVPVIAVEGVGPIDALKRSTSLIKDHWGEEIGGNFNIGLIGFLLWLPAVALIVIAGLTLPALGVALVVVAAMVYVLAVAVVLAAVKQVFVAGLYVYATDRKIPAGFSKSTLTSAFAPKQ